MHHDLVPNLKPVQETVLVPLHVLRRGSGNLNFDLLRTESRMFCPEYDSSRLVGRSNPDRSRSSAERERVVADDLAWAAKFEDNRIIRDGPDAIELVCCAKDDARCVRTIPTKLVVVRDCDKLTVHAAAGVTLRTTFLSLI
jgi:hypothetical protein